MIDDGANANKQDEDNEETPGVDDKIPGADGAEEIPGVNDAEETSYPRSG